MRNGPVKSIAVAALMASLCCGCGAGSGTLPSLIPVKGKVTYKGQPLTKGLVKFEPDGYGRDARGRFQSDGTFVLTTFADGDGVVAGHHRVTVTETGIKSAKDAVARKYGEASASGLTADVDAEHTEFSFDLQ